DRGACDRSSSDRLTGGRSPNVRVGVVLVTPGARLRFGRRAYRAAPPAPPTGRPRVHPTPSISSRPHHRPTGMRPARLRLLLTLLAAVAGVLGWAGPVAAEDDSTLTWSVRPVPTTDEPDRPNFAFTVEPGTTLHDVIRVTNYADQP